MRKTNHILIVDEDIPNTTVLREYLEALGYRVTSMGTWQQAKDAFQSSAGVDLVIFNFLSSSDGSELQQLLGQRAQQTPTIQFSKPYVFEQMTEAIQKAL